MTLITQDDRLTAGASATCKLRGSNARKLCASNHIGRIEFTQHKEDGTKCWHNSESIHDIHNDGSAGVLDRVA